MNLNLSKPICFFDLETTGTNVAKDRIVEISILKIYPNGNKEHQTWLVNPEMNIPDEVVAIHGISNERVANEPTFKELAKEIYTLIKDSDLAGFNSDRFDIPLLAEEMLRSDIDFDMKNMVSVDVQTIFHKMEQRTLTAAYKFYCDKDLTQMPIVPRQIHRLPMRCYYHNWTVIRNWKTILKSCPSFQRGRQSVDFAGFIGLDEEQEEIFTFGKHKGKKVRQVLEDEPGYFGWILNADFPLYTKKVLTQIKLSKLNNKLS